MSAFKDTLFLQYPVQNLAKSVLQETNSIPDFFCERHWVEAFMMHGFAGERTKCSHWQTIWPVATNETIFFFLPSWFLLFQSLRWRKQNRRFQSGLLGLRQDCTTSGGSLFGPTVCPKNMLCKTCFHKGYENIDYHTLWISIFHGICDLTNHAVLREALMPKVNKTFNIDEGFQFRTVLYWWGSKWGN